MWRNFVLVCLFVSLPVIASAQTSCAVDTNNDQKIERSEILSCENGLCPEDRSFCENTTFTPSCEEGDYDSSIMRCTSQPQLICKDGTDLEGGSCVKPGQCAHGGTFDKDGQSCITEPEIVCPRDMSVSADGGACVSEPICADPGTTFDKASGLCLHEIRSYCEPGYHINEDGACQLNTICKAGEYDKQGNRCTYPISGYCEEGFTLNPDTARCERELDCMVGEYNPKKRACFSTVKTEMQPTANCLPQGYSDRDFKKWEKAVSDDEYQSILVGTHLKSRGAGIFEVNAFIDACYPVYQGAMGLLNDKTKCRQVIDDWNGGKKWLPESCNIYADVVSFFEETVTYLNDEPVSTMGCPRAVMTADRYGPKTLEDGSTIFGYTRLVKQMTQCPDGSCSCPGETEEHFTFYGGEKEEEGLYTVVEKGEEKYHYFQPGPVYSQGDGLFTCPHNGKMIEGKCIVDLPRKEPADCISGEMDELAGVCYSEPKARCDHGGAVSSDGLCEDEVTCPDGKCAKRTLKACSGDAKAVNGVCPKVEPVCSSGQYNPAKNSCEFPITQECGGEYRLIDGQCKTKVVCEGILTKAGIGEYNCYTQVDTYCKDGFVKDKSSGSCVAMPKCGEGSSFDVSLGTCISSSLTCEEGYDNCSTISELTLFESCPDGYAFNSETSKCIHYSGLDLISQVSAKMQSQKVCSKHNCVDGGSVQDVTPSFKETIEYDMTGKTVADCPAEVRTFNGNPKDVALSSKSVDLATHKFVGSYCSVDAGAFGCLEKRNVYCAFDNNMSLSVQIQARDQLGRSWGTATQPDCRGLTIYEVEALDFSTINLSANIDEETMAALISELSGMGVSMDSEVCKTRVESNGEEEILFRSCVDSVCPLKEEGEVIVSSCKAMRDHSESLSVALALKAVRENLSCVEYK